MTVGKLVDDVCGAESFPRKCEVVPRAVDGQLAVRAVGLVAELQKISNTSSPKLPKISELIAVQIQLILVYIKY